MRVCTLYESRLGRNDGPPLYWTNAMRQLGIDVTHLSSQNHFDGSLYDAILWIDWGEDAVGDCLPYFPIKMNDYNNTIYVTSDTHLGFNYRVNKAKEFKKVYVNQIDAVDLFKNEGVEATWLPHAVEPMAYPSLPLSIKKYDICFVGFVTFEKRAIFLDRMLKEFPNFYVGQHFFEDCAEKFRESKIVLNTSATDDLNMRFFESWGTGSFTLSEYIPSFELMDLPVDPEMISYKNHDDCVEKVRYYLENAEERNLIAKTMKDYILKYHTYQERVKQIFNLDFIENKEEIENGEIHCAGIN